MKICRGKFIAFLDSDDIWMKDKIEKQIKVFNMDNDVGLVGCALKGKKVRRFFIKKIATFMEITLENLIFKNFFQPSTVMIRKEIIKKIGFFNMKQKYCEDANYFIRISRYYKCILLNEELVEYNNGIPFYLHKGLSSHLTQMEKGELFNILESYKSKYISFLIFIIAFLYSVSKYLHRMIFIYFVKFIE